MHGAKLIIGAFVFFVCFFLPVCMYVCMHLITMFLWYIWQLFDFVAHFSLWPSRHSMDNFMLHIWFFLNLLVTLIVANIVIVKLNVCYLFLCHSNCNRKICV